MMVKITWATCIKWESLFELFNHSTKWNTDTGDAWKNWLCFSQVINSQSWEEKQQRLKALLWPCGHCGKTKWIQRLTNTAWLIFFEVQCGDRPDPQWFSPSIWLFICSTARSETSVQQRDAHGTDSLPISDFFTKTRASSFLTWLARLILSFTVFLMPDGCTHHWSGATKERTRCKGWQNCGKAAWRAANIGR